MSSLQDHKDTFDDIIASGQGNGVHPEVHKMLKKHAASIPAEHKAEMSKYVHKSIAQHKRDAKKEGWDPYMGDDEKRVKGYYSHTVKEDTSMSTRDLIDAIETGDSVAVQSAFETTISQRIADRIDTMRQDVAQNMFKSEAAAVVAEPTAEVAEEVELTEEDLVEAVKDGTVHPDAIHVSDAGGGKYKVHAVGKNFEHGIKAGEHLSDTELDDFQEMGGKIKRVKQK